MEWWKKSVVYQIYPRSFNDSNGDGIGDLQGIIEKLPYLSCLGINAIWLSPVYESPNDDNGYDISSYKKIHPDFGTIDNMEELINEAEKLDIKIIMDIVANHTSDEHIWFRKALEGKESPYRDYYIWRDATEGELPSSLTSVFSGPAWERDEKSNQFYLHMFSKKQPDLNWHNPEVRKEMYEVMNYWLDKGVGGFRFDVIEKIAKEIDKGIIDNGPKLHSFIQEMGRETYLNYDEIMTVGETWAADIEQAKLYSDPKRDEFSMVFQFEHIGLDEKEDGEKWDLKDLDLVKLKQILSKWQVELNGVGWNSLFWNNHDTPRIVSRWGDDTRYRIKSAQAFAIVLHLMKGTPYIYQGEEIGMTNRVINDISQAKDIETINMYHSRIKNGYSKQEVFDSINAKGRDNARTPMQWTNDQNAGFTKGEPWIPLNSNYQEINAEKDMKSNESIFKTYQKLIQLRKNNKIITTGSYDLILENHPTIFAYNRRTEGEVWTVIANMSDEEQYCPISKDSYKEIIINNYDDLAESKEGIVLAPYQAVVINKITKD